MDPFDLPGPVRLARNTLAVLALLVLACGLFLVAGVVLVVAADPTLGSDGWLSGVVFAVPVAVVWLLSVAVHGGAGFMLHRSLVAGRWLALFVGIVWLASPLFFVGLLLIWCMIGDQETRAWWSEIGALSG
ncbi:MAG: hypothetical protein ACI9MC_001022 [Kiritimatiellia bacterium]|jgi:hypothetical protein